MTKSPFYDPIKTAAMEILRSGGTNVHPHSWDELKRMTKRKRYHPIGDAVFIVTSETITRELEAGKTARPLLWAS
jgi:hypothetical protein